MAPRTLTASMTLPLAGYANPQYLDQLDKNNSLGVSLGSARAVVLSVIGAGTHTLTVEETLDPAGAIGWFPVRGKAVDDASGALVGVGGSLAASKAYVFPAIGVRFRVRVTALTVADLVAGLALSDAIVDQSTAASALAAGSNAIGSLAAGAALIGAVAPSASATVGTGATNARVQSAATTNATSVKAAAGKLFGYTLYNTSAAAKFFKLYNKASAPTVGTDTPIATVLIPAGGQASYSFGMGKAFSLGIAYAITNLVADADTTVIAANDVVGHLDYI